LKLTVLNNTVHRTTC